MHGADQHGLAIAVRLLEGQVQDDWYRDEPGCEHQEWPGERSANVAEDTGHGKVFTSLARAPAPKRNLGSVDLCHGLAGVGDFHISRS